MHKEKMVSFVLGIMKINIIIIVGLVLFMRYDTSTVLCILTRIKLKLVYFSSVNQNFITGQPQ